MTSKYPKFERHTSMGFQMPTVDVDWSAVDLTSDGQLVKSGPRKGQRSQSAQRNYFLALTAGKWAIKDMKLQNYLQHEIASWVSSGNVWIIKDDSISVIKAEKPLPIKGNGDKWHKRMSRLAGQTLMGGWLDSTPEPITVAAGTLKAMDGAPVVLCRSDFEKVVRQSVNLAGDDKYAADQIRGIAHDMRTDLDHGRSVRVYGTLVTESAYFKGHFWIRQNVAQSFYFVGSEKKDLTLDNAGHPAFLALSPVHGTRLWMDVQNLAMHGQDGRFDSILDQSGEYWDETMDAVENGKQAMMMERAFEINANRHGLKEASTWWPIEFFASGGVAGEWHAAADALLRGIHQQMRSSHGNMRIPTSGQRLYMCSAAAAGISVERGQYKIVGCSLVFNSVDCITADKRFKDLHAYNVWVANGGDPKTLAPGLCEIMGGMDWDDLGAHFKFDSKGIEFTHISRSPTMVGEAVVFGPDGIIWPAKAPVTFTGIKDTSKMVTGQTVADAMKMVSRLRENAGVVGTYAKALRYYVLVHGTLPTQMPMSMSDLVDAAVQRFMKLDDVKAWAVALTKELAANSLIGGFPILRWLEDEVNYSLGGKAPFKVAEIGDDYPGKKFDSMMDSYEGQLNEIVGEGGKMEKLAMSAYPVPEFFQATEHVHPLAKAFRMHWGKFFAARPEDAAWDDATEKSLIEHVGQFMGAYDETTQEDIVAGSVALAYLKDYGQLVKDYIGFSDATRDLFFGFLRRAGILGKPDWDQHGKLAIYNVGREVDTKVHVPAYGIPGNIEGMTIAFERGFVQQKAGMKERLQVVDTQTGTVLGYLPQNWLAKVVPTMVVESVTEYEGKFVLSGQPVA